MVDFRYHLEWVKEHLGDWCPEEIVCEWVGWLGESI
jgi:hypothetical protein